MPIKKTYKLNLNEVITKGKLDLVSQNAERKEVIDHFLEIGLIKLDKKDNYIIYNPYNDTAKYPNIEKALEFLIKIYKNSEINEANPFEDLDVLEENLKTFEDLKKRNVIPADIKNKHINKFTYQELRSLINQYTGQGETAILSLSTITKTNREVKTEELPNVKPPFKVIKVNDSAIASQLAQGAQWCVRSQATAKTYLENNPERGPLFFVYKNDKQFALFSFGTNQRRGELMDPDDVRITALAMQELKNHWSNLLDYLHAFNITEYDTDLSDFTKKFDEYMEGLEYISDPPSAKFSEIIQYQDEDLMNFFTQKDATYLQEVLDDSSLSKIEKKDSKELSKMILNIVKTEIRKQITVLEEKAKVKVYPIIEKGVVTFNLKVSEMFTYSSRGYNSSSVDSLLRSGITDPKEIVDKRVNNKLGEIQKNFDRFNVILTYDILQSYL
jgi:hypothetical protein